MFLQDIKSYFKNNKIFFVVFLILFGYTLMTSVVGADVTSVGNCATSPWNDFKEKHCRTTEGYKPEAGGEIFTMGRSVALNPFIVAYPYVLQAFGVYDDAIWESMGVAEILKGDISRREAFLATIFPLSFVDVAGYVNQPSKIFPVLHYTLWLVDVAWIIFLSWVGALLWKKGRWGKTIVVIFLIDKVGLLLFFEFAYLKGTL